MLHTDCAFRSCMWNFQELLPKYWVFVICIWKSEFRRADWNKMWTCMSADQYASNSHMMRMAFGYFCGLTMPYREKTS